MVGMYKGSRSGLCSFVHQAITSNIAKRAQVNEKGKSYCRRELTASKQQAPAFYFVLFVVVGFAGVVFFSFKQAAAQEAQ